MIIAQNRWFSRGGNYKWKGESGKLKVALSLFASLLLVSTAFAEYTCELSFPHAPATPLENFPVLVRLANDAPEGFLYEDCPTAAHLWFTDGYDAVLPFEADTWNTSGESLVWVSVPSFSSSTTITMHWSSDAGSVEDSPAAREVWTRAGYNAVWHFSGSNAESATNLVPSATRGIQLVQSAAGINAANVKFEDVKPNKCGFFFKDADGNEYADAAAIEAAGKTPDEIKEIWYRNIRGGFSVIVL